MGCRRLSRQGLPEVAAAAAAAAAGMEHSSARNDTKEFIILYEKYACILLMKLVNFTCN